MNVLLDECVDQRLKADIIGHIVSTVAAMHWTGKQNGALLALAEQQFDVLVTVDRNMVHQQNIPKYNIALIVLHSASTRIEDLRLLAPKLLEAIPNARSGTVIDLHPSAAP